jgi:hypothetical protein
LRCISIKYSFHFIFISSAEEQAEVERLREVQRGLKDWYQWIVFAFGFPGNVLSLVIILGLRCFGSPALYVATMAVVDNMAIVVKILILLFGKYQVGLYQIDVSARSSVHFSSSIFFHCFLKTETLIHG